ncbi:MULTISPECIES: hypothetical protein [Micromonospora]|uniref:Uncharacterized protein n=1 Tax=Micromonospora solifontis TaxID=2487138 RepID=A0ABX9W9D6_9ACTN|nr:MULTISPECIES: hypothetical protein [Micromonospora]NES16224.1 hypothetical protein [Micromonospora sp. PPF5-17B]NES39344.1 hypothetical protein [Micromonospora solifontis]NES57833.1 hypothetical protein [Micromonospora sp. PPF5-6]RNL89318.1 hypothetical protein EFE23_24970 [Micromonospora solifontis]
MSYRDWGGGGSSPPERQPIAPWDDPGQPLPADHASGRYRTPSRRRAIERGQDEPVETYLPRWALESGVSRADGGGRHAAPDEDEDVEPPYSGGGRGTAGGWRRELRAIGAGPVSEHTAEWTFDAPQEQGYVGSRRAESSEDDPVSGPAPRSRPRRAPARRPQVTWSGLEDGASSDAESDRWASGSTGWARSADSWSRPAADPWSRGRSVEADPAEQPAVDPWDASGVHAWDRSAVERWDGAGRWERTEHTGEWDRISDTGQWGGSADAGQWGGAADTGRWGRYAEVDQWDRTVPPAPVREGWASAEQAEAFWSGTRLAGDDPRWMETPTSAPRSPVVPYPAARPRTVPRGRPVDAVGAGGASALRRRVEVAGGSWNRRLEEDLLDPDPGGPLRPLIYTAACYLVPALLAFVGLLFLDGQAPAGCVTDITGGGCDSPRTHAFASLLDGGPRFGLALVSSLVVAVVLRRVGTTWRSATVALAAAVVGGGLSTVVISAVTGQPIG